MSAGYSAAPLQKKLGLMPQMQAAILHAPDSLWENLAELPQSLLADIPEGQHATLDYIHLFCRMRADFTRDYATCQHALHPNGMLWVSWPKKSAKTGSDLDEDFIRDIALASGLVDCKVCAVDEIWSGLKLMYRKTDRPALLKR